MIFKRFFTVIFVHDINSVWDGSCSIEEAYANVMRDMKLPVTVILMELVKYADWLANRLVGDHLLQVTAWGSF